MSVENDPIPLFKVFMAPKNEIDGPVSSLLQSGYVTQGKKVEEFEAQLSRFFGNPRVLTLNSATSGLHLALHLLHKADEDWPGLQENVDEVLTCPLTCTATNFPILANRLRIKWVDADPMTCNMCLADLERKLSPTTKVIMVVHWGGQPVDLDKLAQIQEVCFKRYGFRPRVIEDCAHAIGAEHRGLKLGSHGNMCVFSLQAIKHLTSVDGGILLCPNASLYERGKLLRWFGIDRNKRSGGGFDFRMEPDIPEYGFKFHMNDLNAQIGIANLPHLPWILEKCRDNARYYQEHLVQLPGVTQLEPLAHGSSGAWWLYTVRIAADWRQRFFSHMKSRGVMVSAVHQRNDVHSCVARFASMLPQLNALSEELVCLPVGWWVTEQSRERIVDAVKTFSATYMAEAHLPSTLSRSRIKSKPKCLITGGCGECSEIRHSLRWLLVVVVVAAAAGCCCCRSLLLLLTSAHDCSLAHFSQASSATTRSSTSYATPTSRWW